MRLIDLSHTITTGMAQWPGDEQPLRIHRRSEHGEDSHMSSALEMGCHVGTHIDAPLHFLAGRPGLDRLPVDRFAGRAVCIRLPDATGPGPLGAEILRGHDLDGVDFVLLSTGWAGRWGTPEYYRHWPWLGEDLARALADASLKGVGLDTPSLDPFDGHAAHDICAAADMVNIENLAGLEALPEGPFLLLALPLKLEATEASPVRAVAVVEEGGA